MLNFKRTSQAVLLAAAFAAGTEAAATNYYDGNALYSDAISTDRAEYSFFLGYVAAVHDSKRLQKIFCVEHLPLRLGQLTAVVRRYLTQTPEDRHLDADILVTAALKATWPCPKTQQPQQPQPSLDDLMNNNRRFGG